MSNNTTPEPQWAWLGLLKWSLSYTDGTKPTSETLGPMCEEKKKFLESVMSDGIIDEGTRMREILSDLTLSLPSLLPKSDDDDDDNDCDNNDPPSTSPPPLSPSEMEDHLLELSDICEQIDYANAFIGMGGGSFLLGCASERRLLLRSSNVRSACLSVVATVAQNNPAVQVKLINEDDAMDVLVKLYFEEEEEMMRSRIVRALSCVVRGVAEEDFCKSERGVALLEDGLGVAGREQQQQQQQPAVAKRCLFFLRALLTADDSHRERIRGLNRCLSKVISLALSDDDDSNDDIDTRETALGLLLSILEQKKGVDGILDYKNPLVARGVVRVAAIRAMSEGEEKEMARVEEELWERLIVELARGQRDDVRDVIAAGGGGEGAPLMIAGRGEGDSCETLPQ